VVADAKATITGPATRAPAGDHAGGDYGDEKLADALLTAREHELRQRLRAVLAAQVAPRAAEVDRTGEFAGDGYTAIARAGLGGLLFPPRYGGTGDSTVGYAIAVEEIARACGATSLIYMTQTHAGYPILIAGSAELRERYLPGLCSGDLLGSLAITEPEAGSDAASIRTTARRDGQEYVIDGSKTFITTGNRADVLICFARVGSGPGRQALSAFAVPGTSAGLGRGRVLRKMGMHGSPTAELFFDGVRVPAGALIGGEGAAWELSQRTVVKSRISAAAQGLGLASAAYAAGLRWAVGNGSLRDSAYQAIQFRLAGLRSRILAARLLLHAAARSVDTDERDHTTDIAMVKLTCTDLGFEAASEVVDLLGAEGDLADAGAERLLRDVKVTQIYDGTNEIQRLLVARDTAARVAAA
jgi:alkylation response protein AidB-like acyl-CoA dehydrogenase